MNDLQTLRDAWGDPEAPSAEARNAARAALLNRAAGPPRPMATRFRLPRIGVRLIAVGALAAIIATAITVVQTSGGDHTGGSVASASDALERAARAAENRPFTPPRPDQWIYTEFKNIRPDRDERNSKGNVYRNLISEQQWHSADGKHISFVWRGEMISMAERPGERPLSHPPTARSDAPGAKVLTANPDWPPADYAGLAALPTDPGELLELMLRHPSYTDRTQIPGGVNLLSFASKATYDTVFTVFSSILRLGWLPPKLEAAIFRAMKKIPGVTLSRTPGVGTNSASAIGRDVLVLGHLRGGYTTPELGWVLDQVLLDPRTFRYLGELSNPATGPGKPDCAKVGCSGEGARVNVLLIRAAVVDKPGQRP